MSTDINTDPNRVIIFDTTLRDGEQSPGATLVRFGDIISPNDRTLLPTPSLLPARRTHSHRAHAALPSIRPRRRSSRSPNSWPSSGLTLLRLAFPLRHPTTLML